MSLTAAEQLMQTSWLTFLQLRMLHFWPTYFCFQFSYLHICVKEEFTASTIVALWQQLTPKLFFSSFAQCGFFRRSRYEDSVPRYHAVRIRKEERQIKDGKSKDLETKQWFTKWNENESYS